MPVAHLEFINYSKLLQLISTYIYGAVCAKDVNAFGLVLPYTNTQSMQLFLDELSKYAPQNRHIALMMDNAGWHTAKDYNDIVDSYKHPDL